MATFKESLIYCEQMSLCAEIGLKSDCHRFKTKFKDLMSFITKMRML